MSRAIVQFSVLTPLCPLSAASDLGKVANADSLAAWNDFCTRFGQGRQISNSMIELTRRLSLCRLYGQAKQRAEHCAPPCFILIVVRLLAVIQALESEINRARAKLFFDPQKLVVLCDPIGAAHRSGLDLACAGSHGQIGNERVFGFA